MPQPIVSVAEMRAWEARTWTAGVAQESVIRRAGAAVAAAVLRHSRSSDPVLVLAGRGNNGADAATAEQHIAERDATLIRLESPAAFGAAMDWLRDHQGDPRAVVVDGLFGIGLNRPLEGPWADLVNAVNASGIFVVAVDVPSGLDADTGMPTGPAVEAAVTVTLGAVKKGLLRTSAARHVGRLELAANIGLVGDPEAASGLAWTVPSDFRGFPPRRPDDGHKGGFGHLAILAGSAGYHGAAVLAAQGALRARPGLITVFAHQEAYLPVASQLRAPMVRPWNGETIDAEMFSAILTGPGLASPSIPHSMREEVRRLWASFPRVMIADASALQWLPIGRLDPGAGPRVITPHPGEAARLLECTVAEVQDDRPGALRRLANLWSEASVTVVLKGRHSLVGGREGVLHVNSSGNPGLGQGGTGDLLAGFIAGTLAQPALVSDILFAVRYAVWRHGAVADQLESQGQLWTAEDLAAAMAAPLRAPAPGDGEPGPLRVFPSA